MQISHNKVVRFDYTLTDDSANVLDSSEGSEPLTYLHGSGHIIPGLESALEGKCTGESLNVHIEATEAYGERDDGLVQRVPREMFEDSESIQVGMQFQSGDPEGNTHVVTVVSTDADSVTVDGNHPLAGVPLNFAVTIVDIRDASSEELAHGHVHGPGGHQHD